MDNLNINIEDSTERVDITVSDCHDQVAIDIVNQTDYLEITLSDIGIRGPKGDIGDKGEPGGILQISQEPYNQIEIASDNGMYVTDKWKTLDW